MLVTAAMLAAPLAPAMAAPSGPSPSPSPSWHPTTEAAANGGLQTTLEKVRAQGYVQCGAQERPGLAQQDDKDEWRGLEVEICRAIAVAALGPKARFAFHHYDADNDYASVREGKDQVTFASLAEMTDHKITDKLAPGPTVFVETHDIIVAEASAAKRVADLKMASICFINESTPNSSLDAWFETRKIPIIRFGFREDGEMYDAYEVQRCQAVVGEATELARERLHGGPNGLKSRFLPDHLATFPIVAATPVTSDAQWAGIVAWTIDTLIAASPKETFYTGGGLRIVPVAGIGLGLSADWQKDVITTVGTYDDIFSRTLGDRSPFKLAPGLNAPVAEGGLLLAPFEE